jgi:hypothetical protein
MGVHAFNVSDLVADLYARIPTVDLELEILMGDTVIADTTPTWWQYDTNSSATDNYSAGNLLTTTVIRPTLQAGNGRWLKRATLPTTAIIRTAMSQGTGIGYNSSTGVVTNSAPDQTVVITGATGTYPNFTLPAAPSTTRTTSTQTLGLVGTGATGTQISSTKDSTVRLFVSTSTTSTIGGPATSVVTLKKCATNDVTEGNWTTVGNVSSEQTITLAVVLQSIQVVRGMLETDLPAGWYVKLVNTGSGTHTEAFVSGEKTIYG